MENIICEILTKKQIFKHPDFSYIPWALFKLWLYVGDDFEGLQNIKLYIQYSMQILRQRILCKMSQ